MLVDGIILKCRDEIFEDGLARRSGVPEREVALSDLLEEYLLKLGHSNDHVLAIVLRLLTHGKVRVEFRHVRERLELADKNQIRSRSQAIQLFDEFIAHMRKETQDSQSANMTQRIVVQSPTAKK
ncbi:MAG: hypothetical protein WCS65_00935 [Verrucomicrobiae bacterium]